MLVFRGITIFSWMIILSPSFPKLSHFPLDKINMLVYKMTNNIQLKNLDLAIRTGILNYLFYFMRNYYTPPLVPVYFAMLLAI